MKQKRFTPLDTEKKRRSRVVRNSAKSTFIMNHTNAEIL